MTENNPPQPSTPQTAPAPVPVTGEQTHPVSQVSVTAPASVTATAAAATAAVNNSMNGTGEQLPCQWVGCNEKSPTAEALYVSLGIALVGIAQCTNGFRPHRSMCASVTSVAKVPIT